MRRSGTPHAGLTEGSPFIGGLVLACLLLTAAKPAGVFAQAAGEPEQVVTARAYFEQGLLHVDAEEWAQAAEQFLRVLELRYSAVAAYNLALAHARLGKCVRALGELRELLAQPSLEPTVRDAALALLREEEATVGWLTVQVRGPCTGCQVLLNTLPAGTAGTPIPVDPGHHAVVLVNGDRELDSANLTVASGARVEVRLSATPAAVARAPRRQPAAHPAASEAVEHAPAAALAPTVDDASSQTDSLLASPWFWGGVGVVAAGVVTLGVVLSSGGDQAATPVPGDFMPSVLSGQVRP